MNQNTNIINNSDNPFNNVKIIAEIGINHNGDVSIAKRLIDAAKDCGCDLVKFQKRTIDIVYTREMLDSHRESPWGKTFRAQKEGLEFGKKEYDEIDAYCKKINIDWFASAWDIQSQIFLRQYNFKYNKVASAMATNLKFLTTVSEEKKITFLSTGMCDYDQIDIAVAIFNQKKCPIVLMHTTSEYPAAEDILNLKCIQTLKEKYNCPVGYSGHESSMSPSLVAAAIGAVAIERHITLDRAMYGSDQAASIEPVGLRSLVSMVRKIPVIMGDGIKKVTKGEMIVAQKLRYWRNEME